MLVRREGWLAGRIFFDSGMEMGKNACNKICAQPCVILAKWDLRRPRLPYGNTRVHGGNKLSENCIKISRRWPCIRSFYLSLRCQNFLPPTEKNRPLNFVCKLIMQISETGIFRKIPTFASWPVKKAVMIYSFIFILDPSRVLQELTMFHSSISAASFFF